MKHPILRALLWVFHTVAGLVTAIVVLGLWPLMRLLQARRRARGKLRSLWSGSPIINITVNVKAERLLGVSATTLAFRPFYITDAFDINLSRWAKWDFIYLWLPYAVYIWACLSFDRYHFFFNRGILHPVHTSQFRPLELWLNRLLGKEMFFWTYGSDVRSREITQALGPLNCCMDCPEIGRYCVCDENSRQANIHRVSHYAKQTFSLGDMTEYVPGSRKDLFFWPVELDKFIPAYPAPKPGQPIRVLHAPNHRYFKGSRFLIAAVEKLRAEGLPLELLLVERVPHEQAVKLYAQADIIADQFIIGSFGYFAIEAMALGKPVLCYIRKPEYLLHPEECPIINCPADRIEKTLRDLVSTPEQLTELGKRGRHYVEKYFSVEAFADRLKTAYQDCGVLS